MRYPPNFTPHEARPLIALLSRVEKKYPIVREKNEFISYLRSAAKGYIKTTPSLWKLRFIIERYPKHFSNTFCTSLLSNIVKTQVRSWSGIVPVSVFTSGVGCPFNCHYCANEPQMPKSYFSDEPAVMRAIRFKFDPFKQMFGRLTMLYLSGHPIDKIDLIIQGGTFSFYGKSYRQHFLKRCYDAANTSVSEFIEKGIMHKQPSKNLYESQKINETAGQRVIGATIETRPDYINKNEIAFLRKLGVTRVEIGVQAPDDKILDFVNRGHTTAEIKSATRELREAGFKITYHLMPGLPGSNPKKDINMLKTIFNNDCYKPDNIKLYPTSVVKFSKIEEWYKQGKYKPYSEKQLVDIITTFKQKIVPRWLRIQRLVRDLTTYDVVVDAFPSNLRQLLVKTLNKKNISCLCIRCREIKRDKKTKKLFFKQTLYCANEGKEYFLEYIDKNDRLYGLLRLRIPAYILHPNKYTAAISSLNKCAIVRELHVYGSALPLGKRENKSAQHSGIGQFLLKKAESIAQKYTDKIAVIAGVGARQYYKSRGYRLEHSYMIKYLKQGK